MQKWISAGGVVFDRTGRVALVKQHDRSLRLRWTLPKGRRDPGESIEAAALREVHEETGLRARIVGYLGRHEGRRRFTHYFVMRLVRDDGVHDDETVELRFVKPTRARRMLGSRRDRGVLDQALAMAPARRVGALAPRAVALRAVGAR
jgi:8-oxo-dGTP pyrophosphatase MutT (NUDIX family)